MGRAIRLLGVSLRVSLQNQMAYRADWFARIAHTAMGIATTLGTLWIVFSHTDHLAQWSLREMAALLGVYYIVQGLIDMFLSPNMKQIMADVREGTLDFLLLKPIRSQYYASIRKISPLHATDIVLGLVVLTIAARRMTETVGAADVARFTVVLLCGMISLYSVWLALVTSTFWFVRIVNIEEIIWQAAEAGRYPIDIYPRWVQYGLSYVIPIAFAITFPAKGLLGQLSWSSMAAAVILAVASFSAAATLWRFGLRRYSGASA